MTPERRRAAALSCNRNTADARRLKVEGMAAARAWREANRDVDWEAVCRAEARAKATSVCSGNGAAAAIGHMPFEGHRTQAEVAANQCGQELAA